MTPLPGSAPPVGPCGASRPAPRVLPPPQDEGAQGGAVPWVTVEDNLPGFVVVVCSRCGARDVVAGWVLLLRPEIRAEVVKQHGGCR